MSKTQQSRTTPQAAWWGRGGHRVAVLMSPASPQQHGELAPGLCSPGAGPATSESPGEGSKALPTGQTPAQVTAQPGRRSQVQTSSQPRG